MICLGPFYLMLYMIGFFLIYPVVLQTIGTENSIFYRHNIHISPTWCIILLIAGFLLCLPYTIYFYRLVIEDLKERITRKSRVSNNILRIQNNIAKLKAASKTVCFTMEFLDENMRKLNEVPDGIEEVDTVPKNDKLWDSVPMEIRFFHNDFQYILEISMDRASRHRIKSVIYRENGVDKEKLVSLFKDATGTYWIKKFSTTMFNEFGYQMGFYVSSSSDDGSLTREEFIEELEKDNLIGETVEVYSAKRFSF